MKKYYYHGTSADNLKSILKNGILCNAEKIWNCSDNEIYLWDIEAVAIENDMEDETEEYKNDFAFRMANESGQAACCASKDCRVVVIKVLLDENEISSDSSCENMEGRGAVTISRNILPEEIVEIKISNDLSMIKGYFISLIIDNQYNGIEFDRLELKIAKVFKTAQIYPEDIDDIISWKEINIKAHCH